MTASVILGLGLRDAVPDKVRGRWRAVVSLKIFFLLGYVFHLFAIIHYPAFPLKLATGSVLLGGAVFVFIVVQITRTTVQTLAEEDRLRQGLMQEIDMRNKYLIEANEELEREIAEQRATESALRDSEDKYRSLVDSTDDSIYVVDRNNCYVYMNRKHLSRLHVRWADVAGKPYSNLHDEGESRIFADHVARVFTEGKSIQAEHFSTRDGNHFLRTFSPVRGVSGMVTAVTVISKNITDRKRMEDELRLFSFSDELTGLTNRRGFFALAEHRLKLAQRLDQRQFILYVDLDKLKAINDSLGHQEGDLALVEVANILRTTFRDSDIVARIGGDEFVIGPAALEGNDPAGAVERLNDALARANRESPRSHELSLSVGYALFDPETPSSIDELLAQADGAMYEEKRRKKREADVSPRTS